MMNTPDGLQTNPPYARVMASILPLADPLIEAFRARVVRRLHLKRGDHVIDVGCGAGSSFPYLRAAVGPSGRVIGVEMSPYLAEKAKTRIRKHGWSNVQVIVATAQSVRLADQFDGLLMFATHEVLTSPEALDNLLAHLKRHARVVACGAKQANRLPGSLMNPLLRLASKKWLPFSAPLDAKPWRLLEKRVDRLIVEEYLGGLLYVVVGSVSSQKT